MHASPTPDADRGPVDAVVPPALAGYRPQIGMVAGSGLGDLEGLLDVAGEAACGDIPGLPVSTVAGHAGRLVWGQLAGRRLVLALGRVHLYEGHAPAAVTAMVRLMAASGIDSLLLTNAAGAVNPDFAAGDWMLIEDHLNLSGTSPLAGPRFVDMSVTYDPAWRGAFAAAAAVEGVALRRGVYASVRGPQYETPAEVRMLGRLGADAVGMSTVLEAIEARALGLRVCGLSCLTNLAAGLGGDSLAHDEVIETGATATATGLRLIRRVVEDGDW